MRRGKRRTFFIATGAVSACVVATLVVFIDVRFVLSSIFNNSDGLSAPEFAFVFAAPLLLLAFVLTALLLRLAPGAIVSAQQQRSDERKPE